jgi:hypothetical protein
MAAKPTPLFFAAWAILFLLQDWAIWVKPELLYPATFPFRNSSLRDYGQLLDDADEVVEWLKGNTEESEAVWVNGIENSIYLQANRRAALMSICEAPNELPDPMPRVIVHSPTAQEYNYEHYEHQLLSPRGLYSVWTRKKAKIIVGS